jgi:diketogulonate reductase-like aldo/keto reductase
MTRQHWNRRDVIYAALASGMAPQAIYAAQDKMLIRPIPSSGEALPVVGVGTWQVFDVGGDAEELEVRRKIIELLIDKGGSVVDSSPMYARAEKVVGDVIGAAGNRDRLFLATKVWTNGKGNGESQMRRSIELMRAGTIDLMQVHNLRDVDAHMGTIRDWQQDGLIRYSGVTDYRASALDEIEAAMRMYKPEFVQINYSVAERDADRRLLPLARDLGIAILVNRPFVTGNLFRAVRGRELPDWATPFAESWGQLFLKFIISHPAVNAVIPATSKIEHMADNLGAGFGELPDEPLRQRIVALVDAL